MYLISIFSFILCSVTSFAAEYPYYGEKFYKDYPKNVSKNLLHQILSEAHSPKPGGYDVISPNCAANCYVHYPLSYDQARKQLFGKLDNLEDSDGTYVKDVYCEKKFYYRSVDEAMRMNNQVNTEHTWPQSKFSYRFPKSTQVSDLHHLFLTDSEANAVRGNHEFGNVSESEDELEVADCRASRFNRHNSIETFSPPTTHRGNVARALFYFATRYNMTISKAQEAALREWHKADPVDEKERKRHEAIVKLQKVRNPFIDHPELVEKISDF